MVCSRGDPLPGSECWQRNGSRVHILAHRSEAQDIGGNSIRYLDVLANLTKICSIHSPFLIGKPVQGSNCSSSMFQPSRYIFVSHLIPPSVHLAIVCSRLRGYLHNHPMPAQWTKVSYEAKECLLQVYLSEWELMGPRQQRRSGHMLCFSIHHAIA